MAVCSVDTMAAKRVDPLAYEWAAWKVVLMALRLAASRDCLTAAWMESPKVDHWEF